MSHIEDELKNLGVYVSTTVGYSMMPMLKNRRDRVIIYPCPEQGLRKYDLPLYLHPNGKYILHRIIGVKDDYYLIRGDNTYIVEKVPRSWVIGYVTDFYRKDKHISTSGKLYRLYARFWNLIYPFRYCIHLSRRALSRIKHGFKKQNQK